MRRHMLAALIFMVAVGSALCQQGLHTPVQEGVQKLIVVTTADWDAVQGSLARYQRTRDGSWQKISESTPVVVGRSGLAWDPRLARGHSALYPDPVKHEGDGRSPAGVFQLERGTFGFATSLPGSRKYMPLTPSIECVDDPASRYYAQIVDRQQVDHVDWNSSEKMRSIPQYRWGVIVNYNMDKPVSGDGSCIFLHQWSGPASGTAGCTAMPADSIEEIVRWIHDDNAVLVQLPQSEYRRLRVSWRLP